MNEGFYVNDFEDLLNQLSLMEPQGRKDVAEELIISVVEEGWEVFCDGRDLSCTKTEVL